MELQRLMAYEKHTDAASLRVVRCQWVAVSESLRHAAM